MFQNFCNSKKVMRKRMRSLVYSGFPIPLLIVFLSVPAAVADTVFTDTNPGPVNNVVLQPGTYQVIATGAAGGNGVFGDEQTTGGQGAVIDGTFTGSGANSSQDRT
jgi:hypothetical protein